MMSKALNLEMLIFAAYLLCLRRQFLCDGLSDFSMLPAQNLPTRGMLCLRRQFLCDGLSDFSMLPAQNLPTRGMLCLRRQILCDGLSDFSMLPAQNLPTPYTLQNYALLFISPRKH
jgi:hypothetical protein